jgi:hypothetical protein
MNCAALSLSREAQFRLSVDRVIYKHAGFSAMLQVARQGLAVEAERLIHLEQGPFL